MTHVQNPDADFHLRKSVFWSCDILQKNPHLNFEPEITDSFISLLSYQCPLNFLFAQRRNYNFYSIKHNLCQCPRQASLIIFIATWLNQILHWIFIESRGFGLILADPYRRSSGWHGQSGKLVKQTVILSNIQEVIWTSRSNATFQTVPVVCRNEWKVSL